MSGRTGRPAQQSSQEAQIRTLVDKQKEQILAECQAEINRHEFQAAYDRRSLRKLGEIVDSQQEELHCARAEEVQRRDQQLLQGQLLKQNWDLRHAHDKSLNEMEQLKKFQSSTFETVARGRLVEDQDTNYSGTYWQDTGIAISHHSRVSCLMRSLWSDSSPFFLFHSTFHLHCIPQTVLNNRTIQGQRDSLVDWLYTSLLTGYEPKATVEVSSAEVTPILLRTEEQVSVQCIILVRTSQLRLCLRKSMRDKEWECWRHSCSCRRQKQVQRPQEFITPQKDLCQAHLTFEVQGDLLL